MGPGIPFRSIGKKECQRPDPHGGYNAYAQTVADTNVLNGKIIFI